MSTEAGHTEAEHKQQNVWMYTEERVPQNHLLI